MSSDQRGDETARNKAERLANLKGRFRTNTSEVFFDPKPLASSLGVVLPVVKAYPAAGNLLSVSGRIEMQEQIIKYDDVTFHEGGTLVLNNSSVPWIAIAARKVKFNAPQITTNIIRFSKVSIGSIGTKGTDGPSYDRHGEGRSGRNGGHGGAGNPGENGLEVKVPDVYLFAGEIIADSGNPEIIDVKLNLTGHQGGTGGKGGPGGIGGNGERGSRASQACCYCRTGPGQGGNGGDGGPGGRGGDGGRGSNGSAVTIYGPVEIIDRMSFWVFSVEGGPGGNGGPPGIPGTPGEYGIAGAPDLPFCQPTDYRIGKPGKYPNPSHLGSGDVGTQGARGSISYALGDVTDFW